MADIDWDRGTLQAPLSSEPDWEAGELAEPAKRSLVGTAGDIGVTALKGAVGLPQAVVGLADIPTGGRVGKALEGAGLRFKDAQDSLDTMYSEPQQAANMRVQEAEGFVGTAKAMLENPSTVATNVGQSLPQMLGGAGMARGLMRAAPGVAPWLAGAAGEGVMGAGAAAEQIREATPDGLLTPGQSALAATTGLATGALGAAGGRVAQRLGIGDVDTMLAQGAARSGGQASTRSTARQMIEGAVAEGVLEELPQSMSEQALQNLALDRPWDEGVSKAAAAGLLAGAAMGAAGGGIGARGNRAQARAEAEAAQREQAADAADPSRTWTTEPGAADPSAQASPAATPPEAPDLQAVPGAGVPRQPGIDFERQVDTSGLNLEAPAAAAARVAPSVQMGLDPAAGPLSRVAAMAVDTGAAQEAQFIAATSRDLQVRNSGPGVGNDSNVIDVQGRVVDDRAIMTPRRLTNPDMTQKAPDATTATPALAAPAAALPAPGSSTVETSRAESVPPGASTSPAVAAQLEQRPASWRSNAFQARQVARPLGIDPAGKSLAQIVAAVDAVDATQSGRPRDGSDLAAGAIDGEWNAFAPETGTLGIPRADMPQIRAEHRGALTNFLKARGIDSRADEVPANDLKPTQAEFSPARVQRAAQRQGGDRSILISSDGYVVDGHHQWLAQRAADEPVKVTRLDAPIRDVLQQVAEFPSVAAGTGANDSTSAPDAPAAAPDLKVADERMAGAGDPAPAGGGELTAGGTRQPAGDVAAQPPAQADAGMSRELAEALMRLRPPAPATVTSVRSAVSEMVNGMGMLPNRLGRVVVATAAEIRRDWQPLIGDVSMEAEGEAGRALGFYDPRSKTVFLIADNIRAGDELGVVAHELMHKHGQAVLGEEGWNQLHATIRQWASAPEGSMERQVYDEAARRVEASGPELSTQELFPYAVQVAMEMGVRPNGLAPQGSVARWLAQVRSMLRSVWNKVAGQKGDFNSLDLVNLAFGIAQRENPAHQTELDAATVERTAQAQEALQQLSDADDLYALPKSTADTVEGITAEHDPDIRVRRIDLQGGETMYTLTMADGTRATITSRQPTKDEVFGMDAVAGRWITERPGENAPPVGSRSDVWIDVSALKPGQNGARVYNIAATYAHNTGRIFIGDPSGLSDVALRRRAEQMLSSALKFGTTDHIAPHPRQVAGDPALSVPPLRWVYGDHAGNIERLVDVNQAALENVFPDANIYGYDLESGNFIDQRSGTVLTRQQLAAEIDAARDRGPVQAAGAGWRTVARSAVFRALLQAGDREAARQSDQRGKGPGSRRGDGVDGAVPQRAESASPEDGNQRGGGRLLDGLAVQRGRLAAGNPRDRVLYSRSVAAAPTTGEYTPAQQQAAEKVFGVQATQTLTERAKSFRANLGTKLRQGLVDQFAPIKEVSQHAYMLARLSKGSDGAVEAALLYGKPYLRDGVADVNTQDGGFAQVLATLKGEHDRFFQWVAAQRADRLKAEGRENLLTDQDISALRTLNGGQMADGTARMPLYAAALRELNAFNEASLKVALESGLIDQAAYDLMKDQPYVPFYRLMEEDGGMQGPRFSAGLVNQKAWKKLKGGTQQLNADLLQNTLMNWSHLYAAAARNRASLATMAEAEKLGIAYKVTSDTKGAVKVMREGLTEHWAVEDPYLLEAISALNYSPPGIVKALAPFKRVLTFGVTVNPTFKIRNLIRDSLSAIAQSDLSYNPAENVAKGWKATARGSQNYASMLASGGIIKFGTQENTNHLRGQIERLGGTMLDTQGWDKLKGQMRSLWETYEEFGDRLENVNRTALYERLRAKGLSHAEASFQARDLMDFSMSGKWETVRFLAATVPFLNARMQGLYKLGRAAGDDPRRFAAMAGAVSMASLALMAAYGDDDDCKKREDWDRDNFWWFKVGDKAFRIPKPFEVGAIGTVAERTAELMLEKEMTGKRFGQRISDMVFNTFAMDPTPQAIKPFLDIYANKDSFSGRAIEGMADEKLRPQDRYNERTSEAAKLLGSWGLPDPVRLAKGEYSGLSPKQVDFLLRGYFGWMATVATTATDAASRPLLDRGERPAMRLRDTFLAGNFVESLPTGSSRYVTQMYEQARDVEQTWASYQAAIKSGDVEEARRIQEEDGPKLQNRLAVAGAKRQIAELGQQARRIEGNKLLSAEAKRERLDVIERQRNTIAQRLPATN